MAASQPHHSHEQHRREEILESEEASGSAGLPTTTGNRVSAISGEIIQVKPLSPLHLLTYILPCQPVNYR